ncbi:hypothetical protein O7606_03175 [Micromonospora sp. WMMD882]|uniref:BadF/BadG/BcrA/BcrD ATPase family protein n=1 Tax=Micromonospora sp. WMMD882 TaxID=3015151 RepID=UPI00248B382D|nr:BadF/BadG/BcrA/BcrD ATPase family protein [Micromonospora sp. WMMD882]WBB80397.1 hypothetical protein O7606_03175 [Micromonospora sp. WMMD882]
MTSRTTRLWAVDAGGTATKALLDDGNRWSVGSVNPASVGAPAADADLLGLFRTIAERTGGQPTRGWLATATLDADAPRAVVDHLAGLARAAGLTGELVVSRDVLPLLVARPLGGRGVAVVCGTGTAFLAGDGAAAPLSVGGCEYLGSDEGSAFAIGLDGLRAAVRASDGRGAPTALTAALTGAGGGTVQDLARALAGQPFPKAAVAALAAAVTRCWLDGDAVAGAVVRGALDHLVDGVRAARDRAGLDGDWSATLAGGVFRGCPEFADVLRRRLVDELGADGDPAVVDDPVDVVLRALRDVGDRVPAALADRWVWVRPLGGGR